MVDERCDEEDPLLGSVVVLLLCLLATVVVARCVVAGALP